MKRISLLIALFCLCIMAKATDFTDVSMTVNGMAVKMNNGKIVVTIGSNGRVSSYKYNTTKELLGSSGIYFDYTTSQGNKALSPTKVRVLKDTPEMCEVLYSATSGNTIFEQGYIMRKNVAGLYTYVIATGTATSASEPIKEARVCSRLASTMLQGYVDWRMNGTIPSNAEMSVAEQEENTVQETEDTLVDIYVNKVRSVTNVIDMYSDDYLPFKENMKIPSGLSDRIIGNKMVDTNNIYLET